MKRLYRNISITSVAILWLISLVILVLGSFTVYNFLVEENRDESFKEKMIVFSTDINRSMVQKSKALIKLSDSEEFVRLLNKESKIDNIEALTILSNSKKLLDLSIAYLMDTSGTVLACSPYGDKKTLTGKNYSFRPYFTKALKGSKALYIALGVTTNKRGLYLSHPILKNGEVKGVLVFKTGLDKIDEFVNRAISPILITSPKGVIFSSNENDWMYKTIKILSPERLKEIHNSRQFADKELEYLGHDFFNDNVNIAGKDYRVYNDAFLYPDWRIHFLLDEKEIPKITVLQSAIFTSAFVMFFVLFTIIALLLAAINKRKEAEKSLEQHHEKLEDLISDRTRELEKLQAEHIDRAHKAGMAEVAVSVLHNVGNILNSIVISSDLIRLRIKESVAHEFHRAIELLRDNIDDLPEFFANNPKGKKLAQYFVRLDSALSKENKFLKEQSGRMIERVDAVKNVILTQQDHAGQASLKETLVLADVLAIAMDIQSSVFDSYNIDVENKVENKIPIIIEKNKLVHIIVNLINNAKDALVEAAIKEKSIKILEYQKDGKRIIEFKDNGSGIKKENLESIFNHGFTTKTSGHGFGLHSSANYMTEMGGRMWAESDGEGKGASFFLEFNQ